MDLERGSGTKKKSTIAVITKMSKTNDATIISEEILKKVKVYVTYHAAHPSTKSDADDDDRRTDNITPWDCDFIRVDQRTLFELMLVCISP